MIRNMRENLPPKERGAPWGFVPDIGPNLAGVLRKATTHSVLTPTHWQTAIVVIPMISAIVFTDGWIQVALFWLLVLAVLHGIGVNWYFALTDPDRLQREEHLERMTKMKLPMLADDTQRNAELVLEANPVPNTHIQSAEVKGDPGV